MGQRLVVVLIVPLAYTRTHDCGEPCWGEVSVDNSRQLVGRVHENQGESRWLHTQLHMLFMTYSKRMSQIRVSLNESWDLAFDLLSRSRRALARMADCDINGMFRAAWLKQPGGERYPIPGVPHNITNRIVVHARRVFSDGQSPVNVRPKGPGNGSA